MQHLRCAYTEVWVRSEIVPLIHFADRVRAIADTRLDLLGIEGVDPSPKLLENLRSFDEVWSWYGTGRPEFREAVKRHSLNFRFLAALPNASDSVHASDFFSAQVGGPLNSIPRIAVEPTRHGSIVVHPFSGGATKNWPYERFLELSRHISVEWAATPNEVRFGNLHTLAQWLAGARLYIGNDSGITHLAASAGTPVVALFGPTDPAVWAPRGDNIRIVRGHTMEDIDVEDVLQAVHALLALDRSHTGHRQDR